MSRVPWFDGYIRFHLKLNLSQVLEDTVGTPTGEVARLLVVKLEVAQGMGNGDWEIGNSV